MPPPVKRSRLHVAFEIGVILKGLNGFLELIGGTLLLLFPPSAIQDFVVGLTHNELSRDPNDFIATHLRAAADHLSVGGKTFAAIFLLSHGVIKAGLVYALIRDKLWAFPWAMGVFTAFVLYQMYRYFDVGRMATAETGAAHVGAQHAAPLQLFHACYPRARSRTSISVMMSRGWPRLAQPLCLPRLPCSPRSS